MKISLTSGVKLGYMDVASWDVKLYCKPIRSRALTLTHGIENSEILMIKEFSLFFENLMIKKLKGSHLSKDIWGRKGQDNQLIG